MARRVINLTVKPIELERTIKRCFISAFGMSVDPNEVEGMADSYTRTVLGALHPTTNSGKGERFESGPEGSPSLADMLTFLATYSIQEQKAWERAGNNTIAPNVTKAIRNCWDDITDVMPVKSPDLAHESLAEATNPAGKPTPSNTSNELEAELIQVCTDIYYEAQTIKALDELTDKAQSLLQQARIQLLEELMAEHIAVCGATFPKDERDDCIYNKLIIGRIAQLREGDEHDG